VNWKKVLLKMGKGLWISGGAAALQTWLTSRGVDTALAVSIISVVGGLILGGDNYRKNRRGVRK